MTMRREMSEEGSGGRLVAAGGRELPLRDVRLEASAHAGIARVTLVQRFANPAAEPLRVTYALGLPADAAISGTAFTIGEHRIVGRIDRRAAARERFEDAMIEGRAAVLLEQDRANLFQQEVGNVPAGAEVTVEISIDQPLRWIGEGAWEWRFPTVVPPRYLGAQGRVGDADRVAVDVLDGPTEGGPRIALSLAIEDALIDGALPESTSHPIVVERGAVTRVALAQGAAALDRDVVLRWRVAGLRPGLEVAAARQPGDLGAYALLTVIPPAQEGSIEPVARDLVVLLDTSGSMDGAPLARAKALAAALVRSLSDRDRLELVEFSSASRRWKRRAVEANEAARRDALQWIGVLRASGGTEMREAMIEALQPLSASSQRQVVIVTDGHIGFEEEVVREVRDRLPPGSRLHSVGVGSSVNRALTRPVARAGRGVEVILDLAEDAERGAARLVAATRAPLVVELSVDGDAVVESARRTPPDLLAGAPALMPVAVRAEGGTIRVRGRTSSGAFVQKVRLPPVSEGSGSAAVRSLFGRERVEDLEMDLAAGADLGEMERAIEEVGLRFAIATRATSWVATSDEPTIDPRVPYRQVTMPHELPYGLSAQGLGLRPAATAGRTMAGILPAFAGAIASRLASVDEDREVFACSAPSYSPPARTGAPAPLPPSQPQERRRVAPKAPALAGPTGRRTLQGRFLSKRPLRIAVAVEAGPGGLDWAPPRSVQLRLADGTMVEASVEASASTSPGKVLEGRNIRLVLTLEAALGSEIEIIELASGTEVVEVVL
ncbi:MAG: VWA domain-containing protein [Deltaproteobacteria bacterium]|nr:VWA domain-containing protein [Deltaproteobacteria bacterium]